MITLLIIYLSCCVLNLFISIFWLSKHNESYDPIANDIFLNIGFILTSFIGSLLVVGFMMSCFMIDESNDKYLFKKK